MTIVLNDNFADLGTHALLIGLGSLATLSCTKAPSLRPSACCTT